MPRKSDEIRLALPSKGRLSEDALDLLANAGLRVYKPNPRQYEATIPSLGGLKVLFQRAGDIVVSVRDGSVDFGITGWDVVSEQASGRGPVLPLHTSLGFGNCSLQVIIPESWESVQCMSDLIEYQRQMNHTLRVATKFPTLAQAFFKRHGLNSICLIKAEGTLEIAPTIGYADLIVDLVSTGITIRENRLKPLQDGKILESQACLIANRVALKDSPAVLAVARQLLEFIVAHLRSTENLLLSANMRGESSEAIAADMFSLSMLGGLQGPTIAPIVAREPHAAGWFEANIVIRKDQLAQAIAELRTIGGSGVVVSPVTYIFEEEPLAYRAMLAALEED